MHTVNHLPLQVFKEEKDGGNDITRENFHHFRG